MTTPDEPPVLLEYASPGEADRPLALARRIDPSALGALFRLTMRQHLRARRLLALCLLFAIPAAVAVAARSAGSTLGGSHLELALVFTLIPQALVPLTALLYASGMIQDELEEQTLTYLLVRPLPRWAVYGTKLLATVLVTSLLTGAFTVATEVAVYAGTPGFGEGALTRGLKAAALFSLSLLGYCSVFGCLSLFVRRSLVVGLAYILILEGLVANIDFVARRLTVMYYFRVLTERWLGLRVTQWSIDLGEAPGAGACVLTLAGASLAAAVVAAGWFTTAEFRVKTPEGS
jgi:ABC-2 type transport system permease protein